jgi:DNA-binding transcriptional MerR regulator
MNYAITVLGTHRSLVPLGDAAKRFGLHPDIIRRFIAFGLVESAESAGAEIMLDAGALHRIAVIQHLRYDLGINLPGIGVILELLDRLDALQHGGSRGHQ